MALYCRVSTARQADEGSSLEVQEAKLRAYAAAFGVEVAEVVVDAGLSGATLDRPGLARVLALLEGGQADGVVVVSLSRLTRSVRDLGFLVERYFASGKWSLVSLGESVDTTTAGGRLVLHVLGAVSAWEREAIGERTSSVMRHMRTENRYTGGEVPFGFVLVDGELVPDAREQEVLAEARRLRAEGRSLRAVALELAQQGKLTRNGKPFDPKRISKMVEAGPVASATDEAA